MLNLILLLPLFAAVAIGLGSPARKTALAAALGMLATALALVTFAALPHQGIRWLLRASANLGKLSVLAGLHHREYAEPRA